MRPTSSPVQRQSQRFQNVFQLHGERSTPTDAYRGFSSYSRRLLVVLNSRRRKRRRGGTKRVALARYAAPKGSQRRAQLLPPTSSGHARRRVADVRIRSPVLEEEMAEPFFTATS